MATKAELDLLRGQLMLVAAQRDESMAHYAAAPANCRRLEGLVQQLIDINNKPASQIDRLMDLIESDGLGSFGDRTRGDAGPVLH